LGKEGLDQLGLGVALQGDDPHRLCFEGLVVHKVHDGFDEGLGLGAILDPLSVSQTRAFGDET
jgi:hypothetical protein